jgi:hypothetical protein
MFYEDDTFLVDSVSAFIGAGLRAGDATIVIATEAHREAFAARLLRQDELDVATMSARGQYVALDAAETLSKFMVDGLPDPNLFRQAVGTVFTHAAQAARRVRAFGDMVAILCEEGNTSGAIQLEELWNELGKDISFCLCCGCPLRSLRGDANRLPFLHICKQHSRVIPAESYSGLPDADDRLRLVTRLQQKTLSLELDDLDLEEYRRKE